MCKHCRQDVEVQSFVSWQVFYLLFGMDASGLIIFFFLCLPSSFWFLLTYPRIYMIVNMCISFTERTKKQFPTILIFRSPVPFHAPTHGPFFHFVRFSLSTNYFPPQNLYGIENCMDFKLEKLQCVSFLVARLRGHVAILNPYTRHKVTVFLTHIWDCTPQKLSYPSILSFIWFHYTFQFWYFSCNEFATMLEEIPCIWFSNWPMVLPMVSYLLFPVCFRLQTG